MPTTAQHTFSAANRLDPEFQTKETILHVALAVSTTYARGTVLGEVTATPGLYKPYATGNVDGSQTPKGLLKYGCSTDASGNITILGEWGTTHKTAPMIAPGSGIYKTSLLVGMDAGAVTKLGASLVQGDLTSGLLKV